MWLFISWKVHELEIVIERYSFFPLFLRRLFHYIFFTYTAHTASHSATPTSNNFPENNFLLLARNRSIIVLNTLSCTRTTRHIIIIAVIIAGCECTGLPLNATTKLISCIVARLIDAKVARLLTSYTPCGG